MIDLNKDSIFTLIALKIDVKIYCFTSTVLKNDVKIYIFVKQTNEIDEKYTIVMFLNN